MKKSLLLCFLFLFGIIAAVVPPQAKADFAFLSVTGTPYNPTGPYLVLSSLSGQSACIVALNGTVGGSWAVEGLMGANQTWTPALTVVTPDGLNPETSITAAGSYSFNCADMIAVRLDGTTGTGTPMTLLGAGGGINRVLFNAAGSGAITAVGGLSPIVVNTVGGTATVSCPTCDTGAPPTPVSVQAGANVTVATPSPGVFVVSATTPSPAPTLTAGNGIAIGSNVVSNTGVISIAAGANVSLATSSPGIYTISAVTPSPAPTASPVSVQAGTGISVATPSAGTFIVSNTGVLSVTGSGNITSSGGQTPNVTITNAPTFSGQVSAASYKSGNLTSNDCLESISGVIQSANTACSAGTMANVVAGNDIVVVGTAPTPTVAVTNAPGFTGQVTAASYSAGNLTSGDCLKSVSGVIQSASTSCPSGAVGAITAGSNVVVTTPNPNAPTVSVTNAPTFTGALSAASLTGTGLTTGDCLQASTGGLITTIASACSTASGTLTGITAGSNIVVSPSGAPTPTVAVTNAPSFTGTVTSTNATIGMIGSPSAGGNYPQAFDFTNDQLFGGLPANTGIGSNGGNTINSVQGFCEDIGYYESTTLETNLLTMDCSGNMGLTGILHAANLIDVGLTASNCVGSNGSSQLVSNSSCVQSVSGTGNISSTGGSTPVVSVTNAPTFSGTVTTGQIIDNGLNASQCVDTSASKQLESNTNCVTSLTGTTNQITVSSASGTPTISIPSSPTLAGTTTVGQLIDSGLTATNCAGSNGSKQLVSNTNCVQSVTASGGAASSGGATPNITVSNPVTATLPTEQIFGSGSGTYTTPAGVKWIQILAVGGGGGGGGSNTGGGTGGTGGSTTFGTSLITAGGGVGGTQTTAYGGLGGTATVTAGPIGIALNGGDGSPTFGTGGGGSGGASCLGGAGSGTGNGLLTAGLSGATNTGGGGGGSNGVTGSANGGGSGACVQVIINSPSATYSYAVGAGGTAGAAGTAGTAGGAGAAGAIQVIEHYNY